MRRYQRYPLKIINAVKQDRAEGMSLSDLMKKYQMSKTNVWYHVQGIDLPPEIRKAIRSYMGGSKAEKIREWDRAQKEASAILKNIDVATAWPI